MPLKSTSKDKLFEAVERFDTQREAAKWLGIAEQNLYKLVLKYGITKWRYNRKRAQPKRYVRYCRQCGDRFLTIEKRETKGKFCSYVCKGRWVYENYRKRAIARMHLWKKA